MQVVIQELLVCVFSKKVSVERQSSERSKRRHAEQQNRRQADHERDGNHSSHDSDYERLSACERQMVCCTVTLPCKLNIIFHLMSPRDFNCCKLIILVD